jgi:hypothetical protein
MTRKKLTTLTGGIFSFPTLENFDATSSSERSYFFVFDDFDDDDDDDDSKDFGCCLLGFGILGLVLIAGVSLDLPCLLSAIS